MLELLAESQDKELQVKGLELLCGTCMRAGRCSVSRSSLHFSHVHMQAKELELLLKILSNSSSSTVNAVMLLNSGGLDWCRVLLARMVPRSEMVAEAAGGGGNGAAVWDGRSWGGQDKALAVLRDIIGRLFVGGLFADVKALNVKVLSDFEGLHVIVIQQLMQHIDRDSRIPAQQVMPALWVARRV